MQCSVRKVFCTKKALVFPCKSSYEHCRNMNIDCQRHNWVTVIKKNNDHYSQTVKTAFAQPFEESELNWRGKFHYMQWSHFVEMEKYIQTSGDVSYYNIDPDSTIQNFPYYYAEMSLLISQRNFRIKSNLFKIIWHIILHKYHNQTDIKEHFKSFPNSSKFKTLHRQGTYFPTYISCQFSCSGRWKRARSGRTADPGSGPPWPRLWTCSGCPCLDCWRFDDWVYRPCSGSWTDGPCTRMKPALWSHSLHKKIPKMCTIEIINRNSKNSPQKLLSGLESCFLPSERSLRGGKWPGGLIRCSRTRSTRPSPERPTNPISLLSQPAREVHSSVIM